MCRGELLSNAKRTKRDYRQIRLCPQCFASGLTDSSFSAGKPESPRMSILRRERKKQRYGLQMSTSQCHMVSKPTRSRSFSRLSRNTGKRFWRHGMSSSVPSLDHTAMGVRFGDDSVMFDLADGRTLSAPLAWFPRLLSASVTQRSNWKLIGRGYGVHWPEVDEDISILGLQGLPD